MKKTTQFKRCISIILVCALFIPLPFYANWNGHAAYAADNTIKAPHDDNEIIVVFDDELSEKQADKVVDQLGGEDTAVVETDEETVAVVELPKDQTVEEAIDEYEQDSRIAYAQPNYKYTLSKAVNTKKAAAVTNTGGTVNDIPPYFAKMGVEKAWEKIESERPAEPPTDKKAPKVRVAVIDSGVDIYHEDLQENLNTELCKEINSGEISPLTEDIDIDGHGTHVTGIIGADNNGKGATGIASGSDNSLIEVFTLGVLYKDQDGFAAETVDIVNAINYAKNNEAKVINMSFELSAVDKLVEDAINQATAGGVTVVCAAGNSGRDVASYPSDYPNCISVIATDSSDGRADFSNYGKNKDISAPGVGINSTLPGGPPIEEPTEPPTEEETTAPTEEETTEEQTTEPITEETTEEPTEEQSTEAPSAEEPTDSLGDEPTEQSGDDESVASSSDNQVGLSGMDPENDTGYGTMSGTSMASPIVAGTAALLYARYPEITPAEVKAILYNSASNGGKWTTDTGYGIVNAGKAVDKVSICPPQIKLSNATLSWLPVYGAKRYTIEVIKNGDSKRYDAGARTQYSLAKEIGGIYTVKVIPEFESKIYKNIEDYAEIVPATVILRKTKITYVLGGGTNHKLNPKEYYGQKALTLIKPKRAKYEFVGWYRGNKYRSTRVMLTSGNHTFYARWKKTTVGTGAIRQVKKLSRTKLKVTYKKLSGVSRYEVSYSTSKNFTKKTTKTKIVKSTTVTLTNLKKRKRYYVRVRAYKLDSMGKKVYGNYSVKKSKKI